MPRPEIPTVLIVDDATEVVHSLSLLLKRNGFRPVTAHGPEQALAQLESEAIDAVIQDMNFSRNTSGEEGMALLALIRARQPRLPVILLTGWGSIALAVRGVKAGASDFLTKPWNNDELLRVLRTALALSGDEGPAELPDREGLDERYDFSAILGRDPQLLRVLETVGRVAPTDASVLILGESGTGKELIAEALHRNSRRQGGPFVKVNLGGVSTSLFETEMFGHVKGAFTDALSGRKGRFARAHGGSIFLDEIGDLDPASQVKLLRVLQDRTFEMLGSSETVRVDVRTIAATNRDLVAMVGQNLFREDLLYRLNLITLRLPPLRERPDDIPLLAARFASEMAQHYGLASCRLDDDALAWLVRQPWPGNIRQLRQSVERAVLMSGSDRLGQRHFLEHAPAARAENEREPGLPPVGEMTLDELERAMIHKSLAHFQGNISKVAKALGLSRAALYRRMEKYGVAP